MNSHRNLPDHLSKCKKLILEKGIIIDTSFEKTHLEVPPLIDI